MRTMRILGCNYRIATLSLSISEIERAGQYQLASWIDYAEFERDLASDNRLQDLADEIDEVRKVIRAQMAINSGKDSLKYGCICG